ncbi:MAG TPA: bacteriohopanetetrol glucosamine biosynthesis glycosyltransferase HpnI [Xanthobacteraceae bacterium]|nr:bacteriohopanetetrol glucosamine biosynthesis glycosyltransferase HpnI [Xanthobacteraceae bacterium]
MSELFESSAAYASAVCYLAALAGSAYALFAIWAARSFIRTSGPSPLADCPPVTILKPLHGAEPDLYASLASFCRQDYPAPVQIVFGLADPADPAATVVRRLIADFPDRDFELVINARGHGANAKVSNLINMQPATRHETIVIADSDIAVPSDYLTNIVANLGEPGVGLVTCLYRGVGATGIWSRLAAAGIDYHFLPNVLVGLKLGLATPCFGSTIALTRTMLAKLGGLQSVADQLADDYALGMAARRAGLQVAIAPFIVTHVCAEQSLGELLRHDIRSARTIRAVDPFGFAGLAVTFAVPFALIGFLLGGLTPAALIVVAALACRFALQAELHRLFKLGNSWNISQGQFWLGPIRDVLSFVVFVASFCGRSVEWRGRRYGVGANNTLAGYGKAES